MNFVLCAGVWSIACCLIWIEYECVDFVIVYLLHRVMDIEYVT
jgi:hypothetical protein